MVPASIEGEQEFLFSFLEASRDKGRAHGARVARRVLELRTRPCLASLEFSAWQCVRARVSVLHSAWFTAVHIPAYSIFNALTVVSSDYFYARPRPSATEPTASLLATSRYPRA